jgi:hypothetical protein
MQHRTLWTALLTGNLQKPITFHYSIQQPHTALIPKGSKKQTLIHLLDHTYTDTRHVT